MDKHWKELSDIAKADEIEWNRCVVENNELQEELIALGKEFGFPVSTHIDAIRWMDNTPPKIQEDFQNRFRVIMSRYNIKEDWRTSLWYRVMLGTFSMVGPTYSMGYPKGRFYIKDGNMCHEFIIDHTVAIANPIVQEYIQHTFLKYNPPPQPITSTEDPRKLDWRPVWEWHKRNPAISVSKLAELLGYDRAYLSRKLNELEE